MPVSIVVGGQYGSEGKGKVALESVRADKAVTAVVRVGGPNSGHTGVRRDGKVFALRQIPAGAVDGDTLVILPAGSYIDVDVLQREIHELGLDKDQVKISHLANVITEEHKAWEREADLQRTIGSTGSGTGAAVLGRIARNSPSFPCKAVKAEEVSALDAFVRHDVQELMREMLRKDKRIVIEGSQGFGLSVLHANVWPKATSRDTTAASFLSEAGLSPLDVDDIALTIRCHPIRVAGDSGPLHKEISWGAIAREAGLSHDITELTTVTRKPRRVGTFDAAVVRDAISANCPTRIVLNHLDYVDPQVRERTASPDAQAFVNRIEETIGRTIEWFGTSPSDIVPRDAIFAKSTRNV